MTPRDFCIWLEGYITALDGCSVQPEQIVSKLAEVVKEAVAPIVIERTVPRISDEPITFPTYPPQPMRTGDQPYGPPWEVTCGDGCIIGSSSPDFH